MEKNLKEKSSEVCPFPYDPVCDIAPVDQFGFVDLREAYLHGTIPGDLSYSDDSYNGVEEPGSLLGKSSDVFDALRKAHYVKSAESAQASKDASASSAAND